MQRIVLLSSALLTMGLLVGCGAAGTAPTAKVKGVVTYKNNPVAKASVTFTPKDGRPANGITDAEGKFVLTTFATGDGAVPGTHVVTIASSETPAMPGTPEAKAQAKAPKPFPPKYSNPTTSGFTAEVKSSGNEDFKFEMVD